MKNIIRIFVLSLILFSCGEYEDVVFDNVNGQTLAYFKDNNAKIPIEAGSTGSVDFTIGVTTISSQDRTIQVAVVSDETTASANMYSLPSSTATIPANEYHANFTLNGIWDDVLLTEDKKVVLELTSVENGIVSSKKIEVRLYEGCNPNNLLILTINFDGFASETTWEVLDSSNTVVFSGGPYSNGDTSTSHEVCIPDGNYTFSIFDSYGDGLFDGGTTGTYELVKDLDGTVYASGSGNFGYSETTPFTK